jgi:DNA-binding PadR family transcriptional regulator
MAYTDKGVVMRLLSTIPSDDIVYPLAIEWPAYRAERSAKLSKKSESESFLPLTPAMFQILLALADGEKHGYAILKEVSRRTEEKVRLSAGTLYGNLARLESSGMIVESGRRPVFGLDDERRRYYRLTEFGRSVAVAEARRMEEALSQAHAKHLFRKPETA